jgi:hypothetical protein
MRIGVVAANSLDMFGSANIAQLLGSAVGDRN